MENQCPQAGQRGLAGATRRGNRGTARTQLVDGPVDNELRSLIAARAIREGSASLSDVDLAEVWARALDGLAEMRLQASQLAWLKLTRPLGLVENTALIATPNALATASAVISSWVGPMPPVVNT